MTNTEDNLRKKIERCILCKKFINKQKGHPNNSGFCSNCQSKIRYSYQIPNFGNLYKLLEKRVEQAKAETLKKVLSILTDFIEYANKERKDNHLWYIFQLKELTQELKDLEMPE
jgi:hypothetical protein